MAGFDPAIHASDLSGDGIFFTYSDYKSEAASVVP